MAEVTAGCQHYQRSCALLAPCCDTFYTCRFCHDEKEKHSMCRTEVQKIKCFQCQHVQEVQAKCAECEVVFARYFCKICRLYDEVDKGQFHCESCGICRVGGRDKFFHCSRCDMCLGIHLQNKHKCVEKVSRANCPVCLEDLHSSRIAAHVPPCGHLIHSTCFEDYIKSGGFSCPLCNQSMLSMKSVWKMLDEEVRNTQMPPEYANYLVQILCRDCHKESKIVFHVLGLKCQHCGSYNTCRTAEDEEKLETVTPSQQDPVDVENDDSPTPDNEDGDVRDSQEGESDIITDNTVGNEQSTLTSHDNSNDDSDEDSDSFQTAEGSNDEDGTPV
ncbi:RING finger and CHY zinc finger domain-containing protein 1-like [Glandiceps talaboti]